MGSVRQSDSIRHLSTNRLTLCLLTFAIFGSGFMLTGETAAQRKDPVDSESIPDDPDFHVQGEYQGNLRDADGTRRMHAMQVIARSNGQFEAVVYTGGFPGSGWNGETPIRLQGGRDGERIELMDESQAWRCWMSNSQTSVWRFIEQASNRYMGDLTGIRRVSRNLGLAPPPGATALFRNAVVEGLDDAQVNERGLLDVGFTTSEPVSDFRLHVEFRTPWEPEKQGQGRGNSGVYIQRRYEVQILDSFGTEGAFNECGSLYRQRPPQVNMALPPLTWQTYDIEFIAAKFDEEGNKTDNAIITVVHNGVTVQDHVELVNKTGAGRQEGPDPLPIHFQNHSNAVNYRNLWIAPLAIPSVASSPENAVLTTTAVAGCESCDSGGVVRGSRQLGTRQIGTRPMGSQLRQQRHRNGLRSRR